MKRSTSRTVVCLLVLVFPAGLFAGDMTPAAMLYSHGGTMLNGTTVPKSSALFSGDLVQTGADSVANINSTGSTVLVLNDSLIQFEGDSLKLEHGGVSISTSKSMSASAGDVKISPAKGVLTEFEVRDVDGRVQIAARKGDLSVTDQNGTSTLAQGQETTTDESSQQNGTKNKRKKAGPVPGAVPGSGGAILDSPWVVGIGGGAIIGTTIWVLLQGGAPVSPTQ
jgi:hypothetical protein